MQRGSITINKAELCLLYDTVVLDENGDLVVDDNDEDTENKDKKDGVDVENDNDAAHDDNFKGELVAQSV